MRMKLNRVFLCSALMFTAIGVSQASLSDEQVLVTVGKDHPITSSDLDQAVRSAPFYTQFNTMSEDQQALIRGDLLKRLVAARLLNEEARAQGLDKTDAFRRDVEEYRQALLYKAYVKNLRDAITIPRDELERMRRDSQGNADVYSASKAEYLSSVFKTKKHAAVEKLKKQYHLTLHEDKLWTARADTVLLSGDDIVVRYGDITDKPIASVTTDWLRKQLDQRAELLLMSRAAREDGIDVSADVSAYINERLPALLLEKQRKIWIPDEKVLKAYYDAHPGMSEVPEHWHVGQIVLKTRAQAEAVRKRIMQGESLFELAGRYSIDPYGKSHNGDMGWIEDGKALPALNAVLKKLKVGEVSEVVKTGKGFHLLKIIDAQPGSKHRFAGMKDRIAQAIIDEKMVDYLQALQKKYEVKWLLVQSDEKGKAQPVGKGRM